MHHQTEPPECRRCLKEGRHSIPVIGEAFCGACLEAIEDSVEAARPWQRATCLDCGCPDGLLVSRSLTDPYKWILASDPKYRDTHEWHYAKRAVINSNQLCSPCQELRRRKHDMKRPHAPRS